MGVCMGVCMIVCVEDLFSRIKKPYAETADIVWVCVWVYVWLCVLKVFLTDKNWQFLFFCGGLNIAFTYWGLFFILQYNKWLQYWTGT